MKAFLLLLFLLSGCGYHFEGGLNKTITIHYTKGEHVGELADALIWEFSQLPNVQYVRSNGDWCLDLKVVSVDDSRIGYQYDRRDVSGILRKNLVGDENRKIIRALVTLRDSCGRCLLGPLPIEANAEYDYVDQNSLKDLSLVNAGLPNIPSVGFSLGQLDTIDAAKLDAFDPIYRLLAQKIASGILAYHECAEKE